MYVWLCVQVNHAYLCMRMHVCVCARVHAHARVFVCLRTSVCVRAIVRVGCHSITYVRISNSTESRSLGTDAHTQTQVHTHTGTHADRYKSISYEVH